MCVADAVFVFVELYEMNVHSVLNGLKRGIGDDRDPMASGANEPEAVVVSVW